MENAYELLGVTADVTADDVRVAFRAAVLVHHPDRNALSVESHETMLLIQEAYRILIDPRLRAAHDSQIRSRRLKPVTKFSTTTFAQSRRDVVACLRKFNWGTQARAYRGGLALA